MSDSRTATAEPGQAIADAVMAAADGKSSDAKKTDSDRIDFQPADFNSFANQSAEEAVAALLDYASQLNASDLFIGANEKDISVAMRHLGIVRPIARASLDDGRRWMLHIKALAGIPIDVRRRPNEGRWIRQHPNGRISDLRINTIPTLYGEDFCIRLLERESGLRKLEGLGLERQQYNELFAMLNSPGGLILVTGPTSSGKTTTLYAALQYLNEGRRKINTIEDPVEYSVEGIRQSQVSTAFKVGFPELLRNVLRQSPDVIMVGEIRDPVTAQTAVRAANSGHLVFATLHAPTAAAAIQSMLNLDVHSHFFSSSLRGVVAQRLIRTLCPTCKIAYDLSESPVTFEEVERWLEPGQGKQIYSAPGCPACANSGYTGRTGVFEVLNATSAVRRLMSRSADTAEIDRQAIDDGMLEFRRAGLLKVAQGVTSTEEIIRIMPSQQLGID
jgi:type II secretory ATPase GspE/PulE/Tfp pilus assembly ATPase PilB-like protein